MVYLPVWLYKSKTALAQKNTFRARADKNLWCHLACRVHCTTATL